MATASPRRISGGTYARRRQSTTWSKSATKQRPWNGAFTALEPRAANGSKNLFAKSGPRVRVDYQSSEPAFVKLLISAETGGKALRHTRFKKGQSGNPRGGAKNLSTLLSEALSANCRRGAGDGGRFVRCGRGWRRCIAPTICF